MSLGSMVSGAAKIGAGALKSVSGGALSGGNLLNLAGPLISGGLGLAGGVYASNKSAQVANNVNLLNYKQAKEFAQNQIQWRVSDAKKAGLHPLVALGISPQAGPASAIGADVSGLGNGLAEMGQNISRAIDAYQTREERAYEASKQDALLALKLRYDEEEHRARMAESNANVALKMAETNRILNPVLEGNAVKGSSVKAQPRHGRAVKIVSSPKQVKQSVVGQGDILEHNAYYRDYDGGLVELPSQERANATQNLGVFGAGYDLANYAWRRFNDVYDHFFTNKQKFRRINGKWYKFHGGYGKWYPK